MGKFDGIWDISSNVVKENKDITENENKEYQILGYVINDNGIVSKFGFEVDPNTEEEKVKMKVSPSGFMGKAYRKPMNLIFGLPHPTGFNALIDPAKSSIIRIEPEMIDDEGLFLEFFIKDIKENGFVILISADDVDPEYLHEDIKDEFIDSLDELSQRDLSDLNAIEQSHLDYIRKMNEILKSDLTKENE